MGSLQWQVTSDFTASHAFKHPHIFATSDVTSMVPVDKKRMSLVPPTKILKVPPEAKNA
jgi:hypothetical protein